MTNQHPITPPPELVEQWRMDYMNRGRAFLDITKEIAQWGANQELEACAAWVSMQLHCTDQEHLVPHLRAARRPKPPSLKEQALAVVENALFCDHLSSQDEAILRRALEQLPND
jgi:hypothetical protein